MQQFRIVQSFLLFAMVLTGPAALGAGPSEMILTRTTSQSVDEVVKAIEAYSDQHDWFFMGADKLLGGKITLVKTCIPEVGPKVWSQDLKYTALLPCGNVSIYTNAQGKTEMAVLSGRYLHALAPTPEMKKASDALEPLLVDLLRSIAK